MHICISAGAAALSPLPPLLSSLHSLSNKFLTKHWHTLELAGALSGALWGLLVLSRALWDLSGALWGSLRLTGALWYSLGLSGTSLGLSGALGARSLELCGALRGSLELSGAL